MFGMLDYRAHKLLWLVCLLSMLAAWPAYAEEPDFADLNWTGKINYIVGQGGTYRRDCTPIKEMSLAAQYRNGEVDPNSEGGKYGLKSPKIVETHDCYDVMEIAWPTRYRGKGVGYVVDPNGDNRLFAQTRTNGSIQLWCLGDYYDGHAPNLIGYKGHMFCTKEGTAPRLAASWTIRSDSYDITDEQKEY